MAEPTLFQLPSSASGRRFGLFLLVLACLFVLAFYSVTDPARLEHDHLLGVADYAGYTVCHRLTAHSFVFDGRQMPLCARCTGMYLGIALVFAVLLLAGRWRWSELPSLPILLVFGLFLAVMGVDGVNSFSHFLPNAPHLYEPQNWLRLTTGIGVGLGMGGAMMPIMTAALATRYGTPGMRYIGTSRDVVWLPLSFLRAALGASTMPFETRHFFMYLSWPGKEGQARAITQVTEESES